MLSGRGILCSLEPLVCEWNFPAVHKNTRTTSRAHLWTLKKKKTEVRENTRKWHIFGISMIDCHWTCQCLMLLDLNCRDTFYVQNFIINGQHQTHSIKPMYYFYMCPFARKVLPSQHICHSKNVVLPYTHSSFTAWLGKDSLCQDTRQKYQTKRAYVL